MSQESTQITINLIPKNPFFTSSIGKTFKWALTAGKYIVIFTELVVIFTFLTRFILDRMVSDLDKAIMEKKDVILDYAEDEMNLRIVDRKMKTIEILSYQTNIVEVFPKLTVTLPEDIILQELTINDSSVSLIGNALTSEVLNKMINNYTLSPDFFNVNVEQITTEDTNRDEEELGIHFNLTADFKEEAGLVEN